jgi:hypothetical protein
MKFFVNEKHALVFPAYLLIGFILGFIDPYLGRRFGQLGLRPGLATTASVNMIMPLVAVSLSFIYSRIGSAWLGAVGMTCFYFFGLAIAYAPANGWDFATLIRAAPPVLVLACLGYGILGTLTILSVRAWSK